MASSSRNSDGKEYGTHCKRSNARSSELRSVTLDRLRLVCNGTLQKQIDPAGPIDTNRLFAIHLRNNSWINLDADVLEMVSVWHVRGLRSARGWPMLALHASP